MIGYIIRKIDNVVLIKMEDVLDVGLDYMRSNTTECKGVNTEDVEFLCLDFAIENIEEGDVLDPTLHFNKKRYFEIINRLEELDKIITRDVEQLYADTNITPTYQPMADAITEKQALRVELGGY